jgi:hypothetical protein
MEAKYAKPIGGELVPITDSTADAYGGDIRQILKINHQTQPT